MTTSASSYSSSYSSISQVCSCQLFQPHLDVAFDKYEISRPEVPTVRVLLPPSSSTSSDPTPESVAEISVCRCEELLKIIDSSLHEREQEESKSQQQQQQQPTQFLIPGFFAVSDQMHKYFDNSSSSSCRLLFIAVYDEAESHHRPALFYSKNILRDRISKMKNPFVVAVKCHQLSQFVFSQFPSFSNSSSFPSSSHHRVLPVLLEGFARVSEEQQQQQQQEEGKQNEKENEEEESEKKNQKLKLAELFCSAPICCEMSSTVLKEAKRLDALSLVAAAKKKNKKKNKEEEEERSDEKEEEEKTAVTEKKDLDNNNSNSNNDNKITGLVGSRFEMLGPTLFFDFALSLLENINQFVLQFGCNSEEMIQQMIQKRKSVGQLQDEPKLLLETVDSFVSKAMKKLCCSETESKQQQQGEGEGEKAQQKSEKNKDLLDFLLFHKNNQDEEGKKIEEQLQSWIQNSFSSSSSSSSKVPATVLALLLNMRITAGTKTSVARGYLAMHPHELLFSFQKRHELGQLFSVGARALAKHHHRDESESWWLAGNTQMKGTQAEKNVTALRVLMKIFDSVAWSNVHLLPHDIVCYEIRNELGYGARFVVAARREKSEQVDLKKQEEVEVEAEPEQENEDQDRIPLWIDSRQTGSSCLFAAFPDSNSKASSKIDEHDDEVNSIRQIEFRGFLEPHDEEGHSKGWHH